MSFKLQKCLNKLIFNSNIASFKFSKLNFKEFCLKKKENKQLLVEFELISNDKDIGLITIKNSSKRNALSEGVLNELYEIVKNIPESPRVVILASEGTVFSSGHDLKELNKFDEQKQLEIFTKCSKIMTQIVNSDSIFISEVQGLATAAGCQIAATCDLVVASKDKAKFATPGVKIGLFCTTPSVAVSRSISSKRAMQMLLTGEEIDAQTAYNWGLVNYLVDDTDDKSKLREQSLKLANHINQFSGETLKFGKKSFYKQCNIQNLDEAYAFGTNCMVENFAFTDTKEGVNAFIEKRKPNFNKKI